MRSIDVLDTIASEDSGALLSPQRQEIVSRYADKAVSSALAELESLESEDRQLRTDFSPNEPIWKELRRTMYRRFESWAGDAERLRTYLQHVRTRGVVVTCGSDLADAVGRVRARLQVTPEQTERALDDVRHGRVIPIEELRDELRARRGA